MKRILSTITILLIYLQTGYSSGLEISNIAWSNATDQLTFDITWDYSWYYDAGHFSDAAWVFVKFSANGSAWAHADIATATSSAALHTIDISTDTKGVMIKRRVPESSGTATTSVALTFVNLVGITQDFKVFGIEMVDIPTEAFYAGDGDGNRRVHDSASDTLPFLMTSEASVTCGVAGAGNYDKMICSSLSADYPKGYEAFSIMKYKTTQQQVVDFLNCLSRSQQDYLTESDLSGDTLSNIYVYNEANAGVSRDGIYIDSEIGSGAITFHMNGDLDSTVDEPTDGGSRGMNSGNLQLMTSYLDWAALRPVTFLEYEKACRGPIYPVKGEFAWGSTVATGANANVSWLDEGTDQERLEFPELYPAPIYSARRVGANVPSSGGNRETSLASYYGVIELGSTEEFVVDDGLSTFDGSHGDGRLSLSGSADVPAWGEGIPEDYKIKGSNANVSWYQVSGMLLFFDDVYRRDFRGAR